MAIDTRDKRASALFITLPWRMVQPAPDGTIGVSDRLIHGLAYSGIAADAPPPPPPPVDRYFNPMVATIGRMMNR